MLRKFAKTPNGGNAVPLSIIGSDVRIVGDIFTEGEMQIDGRVEGDITCKTLVIGPEAHIAGEIKAETIRIHGEVTGRLAAETVIIGRTGRITGDICHGSLEIQSGAQVEGHFLRKEAPTETVALPKPSGKGNGSAKTVETVKAVEAAKVAEAVEVSDAMANTTDVPATVN